MQKVVLITGCSTGIGAAMASTFAARGCRVFATARRPESLDSLQGQGIEALALDVNDDQSIAAAMSAVQEKAGRLDILVNNAGFSRVGAVLDLQREDLRSQYETNVISPMVVTGQAMPLLRAAVAGSGSAMVVNIGSIVGLFTTPFAGAYCSSKAAVHSLGDALRMEVAPFGVRVVTVQPGGVQSSFGDNAEQGMRIPDGSIYKDLEARIQARAQAGQQGATPTLEFVEPVVDKLLKPNPPAIIRGGKGSVALVSMKKMLPLKWFDGILSKRFGLSEFKPDN